MYGGAVIVKWCRMMMAVVKQESGGDRLAA